MKLDGAIFAIEPRSIGGCIDLAAVFVRTHFLPILALVAWFAVPSVCLTWWLSARADWTLNGCLLLFVLESPFLGAALVASAGPRVFGETFSVRKGLWSMLRRLLVLLPLLLLIRLLTMGGAVLFVLPAYFVAARYGFVAEVLLLEMAPLRRLESRFTDLLQGTYRNLVGRLVLLMLFFVTAVLSLFMLVDTAARTLFGLPVLTGRVSGSFDWVDETMILISYDPRVAVALVSVLWLVYPLTRLAWMFCYLDTRIRTEGWDVELDFRVEARRLEAAL